MPGIGGCGWRDESFPRPPGRQGVSHAYPSPSARRRIRALRHSNNVHGLGCEVCKALNVPITDDEAREVIAIRIIDLAERGEHSSIRLRDRVLKKANGANCLGI